MNHTQPPFPEGTRTELAKIVSSPAYKDAVVYLKSCNEPKHLPEAQSSTDALTQGALNHAMQVGFFAAFTALEQLSVKIPTMRDIPQPWKSSE
jgi:hypothetical protein